MNIKVTVLEGEAKTREGTFDDANGKEVKYRTRKQQARLECNGFAYPFDVRLEDGQPAYAVGDYVLNVPAMLQVNKGSVSLSKFAVLTPAAAADRKG